MDLNILKKVPLFEGLTHAQLSKVASVAQEREFEGSTHIFKEGDPGKEMFVIVEGKVRISKMIPGIGEEALAVLERGSYFGEMAVVEGGPRSADAIAHIPCKLSVIDRDQLEQLMFTDKDLAYVLLWTFVRTLSERLRETNEKVRAFFAVSKW